MRETTTTAFSILILGLGLVACDGVIADPFGGGAEDDPRVGAGGGAGGGGAGPGSVTPELCAGEPARVGTTPVRRLNRSQYAHSVTDILGLDALPAPVVERLIEIPDGRRGGFESSTEAASSEVLRSYLYAAEALADAALAESAVPLASCELADSDCARALIERLGRRAFRRPLTTGADGEIERYLALCESIRASQDAGAAAHAIVTALFTSPSFLYLAEPVDESAIDGELVPLDPYALASRLSYFLWDSAPDEELLDAAAAGTLADPDGRAAEIDRMLGDPRARRVIHRFHEQWMRLDELAQIDSSDPALTSELRAAMRAETLDFVERTVHEGAGTLKELLTASHTYASPELAEHYGAPPPDADGRVELDPNERAGILTHASLLTGLGVVFPEVHRGLWVRNELLCDSPPPPPPDVPLAESAERLATPACATCHTRMDLIGFGFADYDALGRYRPGAGGELPAPPEVFEIEGGRLPEEVRGSFSGPRELADRLAASRWVNDCVSVQWVRFATGREDEGADACGVLDVSEQFAASGGDITVLLEAIASSPQFRSRSIEEVSP